MIAKQVSMHSLGKSNFAQLATYITDSQDKSHRLEQIQVTHCASGNVKGAIAEILATQYLNTRAKSDKTYHLIVSFRAGEQPSLETINAIEQQLCTSLGFQEHQRISALHSDTDHLHLHIAINKIHPVQHTLHEPYYSYRTLASQCEKLEQTHGLEHDNHVPQQRASACRAADMEHHSGLESLLNWIKRECLNELRQANSWAQLQQKLHENGLTLREQGNGFVLAANSGVQIKASTVARELSKNALERRLGAFRPLGVPEATPSQRSYQKQPLGLKIDSTALYASYQQAQQEVKTQRASALLSAREQKTQALSAAMAANQLKRASIPLFSFKNLYKKMLYDHAKRTLSRQREQIKQDYAATKQRIYHKWQQHGWVDWLKQQGLQGDTNALAALRARTIAQARHGNAIQTQPNANTERNSHPLNAPPIDSITNSGTIIYREGQSALRDDGKHISVSNEATGPTLEIALRIARQRFGDELTLSGTHDFKRQIVRLSVELALPVHFIDKALEHYRQQLAKAAANPPTITATAEPPPRHIEANSAESSVIKPATDPAVAAALQYIAEREAKRMQGLDILKHAYQSNLSGLFTFAGLRSIDGQNLALLKRGEEVWVLPIDATKANQRKRLPLGASVTLKADQITTAAIRRGYHR